MFGLGYPQVLDVLAVPTFLYGLYAAVERRFLGTAAGTLATMALKPWFVAALIAHHDRATGDG